MTNRSAENSDLSGRERQIAEVYARCENYDQVADRLCLAPSTVRTHLATIYRKLGVSSKLELRDTLIPVVIAQPEPVVEFPARPEKPSIAVLAFENMSGDQERKYFPTGSTTMSSPPCHARRGCSS